MVSRNGWLEVQKFKCVVHVGCKHMVVAWNAGDCGAFNNTDLHNVQFVLEAPQIQNDAIAQCMLPSILSILNPIPSAKRWASLKFLFIALEHVA